MENIPIGNLIFFHRIFFVYDMLSLAGNKITSFPLFEGAFLVVSYEFPNRFSFSLAKGMIILLTTIELELLGEKDSSFFCYGFVAGDEIYLIYYSEEASGSLIRVMDMSLREKTSKKSLSDICKFLSSFKKQKVASCRCQHSIELDKEVELIDKKALVSFGFQTDLYEKGLSKLTIHRSEKVDIEFLQAKGRDLYYLTHKPGDNCFFIKRLHLDTFESESAFFESHKLFIDIFKGYFRARNAKANSFRKTFEVIIEEHELIPGYLDEDHKRYLEALHKIFTEFSPLFPREITLEIFWRI